MLTITSSRSVVDSSAQVCDVDLRSYSSLADKLLLIVNQIKRY